MEFFIISVILNGAIALGALVALIMGVTMWLMPDKFCIRYRLEAFLWALLFGFGCSIPTTQGGANLTIITGIIVVAVVIMIILLKYPQFYNKRKIWIRIGVLLVVYLFIVAIATNSNLDLKGGFSTTSFLQKIHFLGNIVVNVILLALLVWVAIKYFKLPKGEVNGCKCPQCNKTLRENTNKNEIINTSEK